MSIVYIDCFAGVAGDMLLGALLDNDVMDPDDFAKELGKLGLKDEYELKITRKMQKGIAGTDVDVIDKNMAKLRHAHKHSISSYDNKNHFTNHDVASHNHDSVEHSDCGDDEHPHTHDGSHMHEHNDSHHDGHNHEDGGGHSHNGMRNYKEICSIIQSGGISSGAKARALAIFKRIGEAEARVHGVALDDVHFHEVGAIDSIVDIVGSAILFDRISPSRVVCSPIHVGSGIVKAAHGVFGVPAPATAFILRGCPIYATDVKGELCTPTGAAIAATMADSFGPIPAMTTNSVGHGFGKKDFGILNFLRVFLGEEGNTSDAVTLLEANIDDMTGEAMGFAMDALFGAGALDVWFEQIIMKKNRPAVKLCVLVDKDVDGFERIMFDNTTTIGVRRSGMKRGVLERRQLKLSTEFGDIDAKAVKRPMGETVKPEYDSVIKAALSSGQPYNMVYEAAMRSARDSLD